MTINGTNGVSASMSTGQLGMSQASDPVSKNIQNQIARVQKQLQELSANTELGAEEKMKKRQELQKQISDLNMQLRQHQIEQRREKQQEQASFDDMLGGGQQTDKANGKGQAGVPSQASMEAMISADTAMSQAKVQGSVATKMEDRAGILEIEIELDKARGCDTRKKEEELADVEQKAQAATSSQLSTLADASRTMEEAAKEDSEMEKTDGKDISVEGKSTEGSVSGADVQEEVAVDVAGESTQPIEDSLILQPTTYTSVDIRL